ncbi:MAG: hypothetical protein E7266_01115 [Lachnospiraceae bacterium]|nr:hypothetical protein [Lachnospiraceae bacterium]
MKFFLKKYSFIPALIILFTFLISSSLVKEGTYAGLKLWLFTVFPTLFPFILTTEIIKSTGGIEIISKIFHPIISKITGVSKDGAYPVVIGFLCGFPMGAKSVSDVLEKNKISSVEATYLLTFCNMLSPGFLSGYYCTQVLGGYFNSLSVLIILYLAQISTGLLFRQTLFRKYNFLSHSSNNAHISDTSFSLDTLLKNSLTGLLKIAGYIIIFSILCQYINRFITNTYINISLLSLSEITTGLNYLCIADVPIFHKVILGNIFIGFGGICGLFQTIEIIKKHKLPIRPYLFSRLVCAMFSLIYSLILTV